MLPQGYIISQNVWQVNTKIAEKNRFYFLSMVIKRYFTLKLEELKVKIVTNGNYNEYEFHAFLKGC